MLNNQNQFTSKFIILLGLSGSSFKLEIQQLITLASNITPIIIIIIIFFFFLNIHYIYIYIYNLVMLAPSMHAQSTRVRGHADVAISVDCCLPSRPGWERMVGAQHNSAIYIFHKFAFMHKPRQHQNNEPNTTHASHYQAIKVFNNSQCPLFCKKHS